MRKYGFFVSFFLTAAVLSGNAEMTWNREKGNLKEWRSVSNARGTVKDGTLTVTDIRRDMLITKKGLKIDPKKYNAFTFTYRAEKSSQLGGQLYFAGEGERFTDACKWLVPRLTADGKWHTMSVMSDDMSSWLGKKGIVALRFDPTDGAGGKIEFSEFKLENLKERPVYSTPLDLPVSHWVRAGNAKKSVDNGTLILTDIRPDSQLYSKGVNIDPADYNAFTFTYRATGVRAIGGQLYFIRKGEGFSEESRWKTPKLIADGKWHTVSVSGDMSLWRGKGNIVALRFDPTDASGGRIELKDIKLEYLKKVPEYHDPLLLLASAWSSAGNAKLKIKNGNLLLTDIKSDSQLYSKPLSIDPKKYNALTFRYRGVNFSPLGGQLYFARPGKGFSDHRKWRFDGMEADGQWHTMTIMPDDLDEWRTGGNITALRLDPTDGAGGEIEFADIRLEYLNERPATAAATPTAVKLDAPEWPKAQPGFMKIHKPEHWFTGKMVRSPLALPKNAKHINFYLRKEFTLKEKPLQAFLQGTADDYAEGFINGKSVGKMTNWAQTFTVEIKNLTAGKNVLAFHHINQQSWSGVLFELYIRYADGSEERIISDRNVISSVENPAGWNEVDFDSSKWQKTLELAPPPSAPWNRAKMHYFYYTNKLRVTEAKQSGSKLNAGDTLTLTLKGEGEIPEKALSVSVYLYENGTEIWQEKITIDRKHFTADGKKFTFNYDYKVPQYFNTKKDIRMVFAPEIFGCGNGAMDNFRFSLKRTALSAIEKEIPRLKKEHDADYGTYITCNGKPFFANWGAFYTRDDGKYKVSDAKYNIITTSAIYVMWHLGTGKFDFDVFNENMEKLIRENPDAKFFFSIHLYTPRDFLLKYPDEVNRDENGALNRHGNYTRYSFASKLAEEYLCDVMEKVIEYAETSPFAHKIAGYRIGGGTTCEWLGWESATGKALDFSERNQQAFTAFCKKYYPELKDTSIPKRLERHYTDGHRLVRDQQKHLRAVAYNEFDSYIVAEHLAYLCSKARAKLRSMNREKLIITYYGYISTLNHTGAAQYRAHFALKELLKRSAENIDIIISPQSYPLRNLGDTCGDMKPFASLRYNGVIAANEDDTRSHNGRCIMHIDGSSRTQSINEYFSTNVMRRNLDIALCRNIPNYYYAIASGTDADFDSLERDTDIRGVVGQFCLEKKVPRRAKIALVVSEKSIVSMPPIFRTAQSGYYEQFYTRFGTVTKEHPRKPLLTYETFVGNQNRFARSGAPADALFAEDLADHPGDYKVYVFMNCTDYDEKFLAAVRKLQQKDCILIWLHAPGNIFKRQNSLANMKQLTGFTFEELKTPVTPVVKMTDGRMMGSYGVKVAPMFTVKDKDVKVLGNYANGLPGVTVKRVGKSLSIFSAVWQLDMEFVKEILKMSGIHSYSELTDPLEANDALISVHARFPGKKKFSLPKKTDVLDVYNKKIIARKADTFEADFKLHESKLFYYGDDADELLKKLNQL